MSQQIQLPNLELVSDAFGTLQTEIAKVSNLPAWNEAATITAKFNQNEARNEARHNEVMARFDQNEARHNQLMARFDQNDTRHTQLLQHITAMNSNIETISTRLDATQWNTNARFANFTANDPNSLLVPLHHHQTNEEIPHFPGTLGDIQQLNHQKVNVIIQALGASVEGSLEKKKAKVRRLVGLPPTVTLV